MAKAYMTDEIKYFDIPYWAEERHHDELVKCYSGSLFTCLLKFSGCKKVGDFLKWQELGNYLEIRYWDAEPSTEERLQTPWTPYVAYKYIGEKTEILRLTEEEFKELKEKYKIYDVPPLFGEASSFRECYACDNPKMEILRSKT